MIFDVRLITGKLSALKTRLLNNPDYLGAIVAGYGLTGTQILVQIVLVPLYITILGKPVFGALMVLVSFANVARIGIGWMSGRMLRVLAAAFARRDEVEFRRARRAFRQIFLLYGLLAALVLCAIGFSVPHILVGEGTGISEAERNWTFVLIGVYEVGLNLLSSELAILAARKQRTAGMIAMIINLFVFGITAVTCLLLGAGIIGVAAAFAFGAFVGVAACIYWGWRSNPVGSIAGGGHLPYAQSIARIFARYAGRNAGSYALHGILSLVLQSDTLVIGIVGGPESAANFVLVWKVAEVVAVFLSRFSDSLQPELIESDVGGDRERLVRIYRHGIRLLAVLAFSAGAGYAAFGDFIVRVWIGKSQAPDSPLGYALAGGALFWVVMAKLPTTLAYALVRLRPLNQIAATEAVGRVALIVGLFPVVGYVAPLVAVNAVYVLGIAYAYIKLARTTVLASR